MITTSVQNSWTFIGGCFVDTSDTAYFAFMTTMYLTKQVLQNTKSGDSQNIIRLNIFDKNKCIIM